MPKKLYLYESHTGGFFIKDRRLTPEEEYCETCNDSDWLMLETDNLEDVAEFFRENKDYRYPVRYIHDIYKECEEFFAE